MYYISVTMEQIEFPILGEPPGIELANTMYGSGDEAIDFLADPEHAVAWVAEVAGATLVDDVALLRELRDAVRHLVAASAAGRPLGRRAIGTLNRHAAAGCASVALKVDALGNASSVVRFRGDAAVRARLAVSCIEVLTGPHPIHRCEGEGCGLFFAQQHGRRRFCHDGCSHRARQQRYRRMQS